MKLTLLLTLISSLLLAETHHFKEVNHHGKTLKNVELILNNSKLGFDIRYKDKLLKRGAYMIISCKSREGFCLVEDRSNHNWTKKR